MSVSFFFAFLFSNFSFFFICFSFLLWFLLSFLVRCAVSLRVCCSFPYISLFHLCFLFLGKRRRGGREWEGEERELGELGRNRIVSTPFEDIVMLSFSEKTVRWRATFPVVHQCSPNANSILIELRFQDLNLFSQHMISHWSA